MVFPFEAVVGGFLGVDQRAGQAVRERAATAIRPEANRRVERLAADADGWEQGVKRVDVICRTAVSASRTRQDAAVAW